MEGFKPVFEIDIPLHPVQSPTVRQFEAKHKAFLLYWMWFADHATKDDEDPKTKSFKMSSAADVASDIMGKMYGLDVTAPSIEDYYGLGRKNAKDTGVQWGRVVAATIDKSIGRLSYSQFANFSLQYDDVVSTMAPLFFFGSGGCLFTIFNSNG